MKNIILLFLILISTAFSAQQNLKINGKIINSDKEKKRVSHYDLSFGSR